MLRDTPKAALAAIIIMSLKGNYVVILDSRPNTDEVRLVIGMFEQITDALRYWRVKTKDFVIWAGTFIATIIFDIPLGKRA